MAKSVSTLKTQILLGTSSVIQGTKQSYDAFMRVNSSVKALGQQMNNLKRSSAQTEVQIKGLTSTLLGMAGALKTLDRINAMFSSVLGGAYNYSKTLETNAVGIGGILTSMVKVNGKQLEWNESMKMSVGIMNELRKQALQTSATAPELIDTFRALLGPGLGSGMKIDEIMKLTKVGVTAVKSIGLDGTQLVQELRSMIQGSIRPASSTLATALGITNTDVKNAKASAEGLYQFLMKRLTGFEQSVRATAGTVQGRLDILKEGIYQGIEEGTKPLWQDFKDELYRLTENFLVFDKKTKEIGLNPKFVENVKTVSDTIMTIKNGVSFLIRDLTTDSGSIMKGFAIGAIIKLSGSVLNSIIGLLNKCGASALDFFNKISLTNIALEKQQRFEQALMEFSSYYEKKVATQKELNGLIDNFSNTIYNLSKRYQELGATAEQAMKRQNDIVYAINNGASAKEIQLLMKIYEEASIKDKERNEQALNAQKEKIRLEKEELEIKKLKEKYEKEARSNLLNSVSLGKKQAKEDRKINDYILGLQDSSRGEESLGAFAKRLQAANNSFFPENEKAYALLEIKKLIWQGDYKNAIEQIAFYDNYIARNNELQAEEEKKLSLEKEIAKTQREQYSWLNKQIEANVKLATVKPKNDEQAQQFKLFQRSVNDAITDANASKQSAKLSKNEKILNDFISGNSKSKAYNETNVTMLKDLIQKVKDAGFSEQQANEYAKGFLNKIQSTKVSAEKVKQIYDESINQLGKIGEKLSQVKAESEAVFTRAVDAGLMNEQAQKLKEAYVREMTNGSRESAKAWREAFDNNILAVQEKINGIAKGTQSSTGTKFNPNNYKTDNLYKAMAENDFDVQRSLEKFSKYSPKGVEQIKEAFLTLNKALNEQVIKQEEYVKIVTDLQNTITHGYMDESIAIAGVIKKQYELNTLAGENAKKERDIEQAKAKTVATERQEAVVKELLVNLEENYLTATQRETIIAVANENIKGKGFKNTEQALQRLIAMEKKMAEHIAKTGQIAPPVYKEILALIDKLRNSTKDLTEGELNHIKVIEQEGQAYTKFGSIMESCKKGAGALFGALTSVGFVLQGVGIEAGTTAGKFAEMAIQVGFVGSTVASLTDNLKILWGTIKAMSLAGVFKLVGGIGAVVAGTLALNAWSKGQTLEDFKREAKIQFMAKNKAEADAMREAAMNEADSEQYNVSGVYDKTDNKLDFSGVTTSYPPDNDDSKAAKKAEREAKRLEALRKKINEAKQSYKILNETIDISNGKLTGSYTKYQESIDGATKKTDQWKKTLIDAVIKAGGAIDENGNIIRFGEITKEQYDKAIVSMERYEELVKKQAGRELTEKMFSNQLQNIKNLESINNITTSKANEMRIQTYNDEIKHYQDLLKEHNLTEDKKIEYETIIAEKRKAIREAETTDGKIHWDTLMEHIKNTTFDQTAVVTSTFDSMLDSFTNFGQNFLTQSKSLSEMAKDLFKSFANSIWNMMMKLLMQALTLRMIMSVLGGGGKAPAEYNIHNIASMEQDNFLKELGFVPTCANGGYANGWTIVGEKGPELVNFSSPGRVYTAEQTKNALSGGSGNVNIKIDLKNESGQEMKAETTGTQFDGESYIVGVVLKAISNNTNGMRSIVKGLANA